jgi:aminoglycoside 3-N-acetyltransferase
VHSSLSGTGIDPEKFIEELVDEYGTVLFPTYNWGFGLGEGYDCRNTPSDMGYLTNLALSKTKIRTGHPMYNFAVLGKEAELFENVDNYSGLGAYSPFGILHHMDGEIMVVNLKDTNSMTFYHYVEEVLKVPYKELKEIEGQYWDKDGILSTRKYAISIRKPGVLRIAQPMWEILEGKGLYKHKTEYIRTIKARVLFNEIAEVINTGKAEGILWKKG